MSRSEVEEKIMEKREILEDLAGSNLPVSEIAQQLLDMVEENRSW